MAGRWGLAGIAWVVVAIVTTLIGVAAINSLGNGILGSPDQPLTESDVQRALASPFSTPPVVASPEPAPVESAEVLVTFGGSIVASCSGDLVTLQSWSPNQGFRTDHVNRGPAQTASLRFKNEQGHGCRDARVSVSCQGGVPVASTSTEDD